VKQSMVTLSMEARNTATGEPVPMPWPPLPSPLTPYLKAGDGVLDLGANVGQMARTYADAVGAEGYVLAVEADPHNATLCDLLTQAYPQIHVLPVAVAEACGVRVLHQDAANMRRQSLWRANLTHDSAQTVLVPTLTLDTLARAVPKLAGIKIDVQGAEFAVLTGGQATLNNPHLTWCVEFWDQGLRAAGSSAKQVADVFEGFGWRPVDTTWTEVLVRVEAKPHGVQNIVMRHRENPLRFLPGNGTVGETA
jgi:FkbM family methyltransferase